MVHMSSESERLARATWRVGDWIVDTATDQLSRGDTTLRVEARTMRLLVCLAQRAGEVVSIDDLLGEVWAGVIVTPDSVYQAVTSLRRLLGDDPKQPRYIATVPRRGYRLIAPVEMLERDGSPVAAMAATLDVVAPLRIDMTPPRPRAFRLPLLFAVVALVLLAGVPLFHRQRADVPPAVTKSIAVLPFLDLTDTMNEEPFADGMTEELIDKLSKVPGIKVSAPTSSFYFKDKQVPVAEIARSLGVAYILDGSVRTSGGTMRVAARVLRAQDGFVIWSATYDRPLGDKLKVQDDIAGEAANALAPTIK